MEFWANWANLGKFEIWAKLLPKLGKFGLNFGQIQKRFGQFAQFAQKR